MVGKPASEHTKVANRPDGRIFDPLDMERVRRGYIGSLDEPIVDDGRFVLDAARYDFQIGRAHV